MAILIIFIKYVFSKHLQNHIYILYFINYIMLFNVLIIAKYSDIFRK